MTISLPYEVVYIIWKIQTAGFDAHVVGGAVRDILLQTLITTQNKTPEHLNISDYDFTTNATPQQIQQIFDDSYYTNEFGTVGIAYSNLLAEMVAAGYQLPNTNIKSRLVKPIKKNKIIDLAAASKIHESLRSQIDQYQIDQKNTKLQPTPFEITTYRSDGLYSDFRRPDKIEWGQSIEQDLERRDFTINAMALTIEPNLLTTIFNSKQINHSLINVKTEEFKLVDLHHGLKDLAKKQVKTVRNPDERFKEDALRMLRAIRLACQLQFELDPLTQASIAHYAHLIQKISWERIKQEFLKIMTTSQPDRGINLLDKTGLLAHIMPELQAMKGVEQGGHHDTDVWTHSLDSLKHCPSKDPIVKLATLLHDVGKPATKHAKNGGITFYNHEIVSSRLASKIGKRLRLSNQEREKLFRLVRHHMFYYQPYQTDTAIRRMIKRVGLNYIDDILDLREGDRLGSGARQTSWRLEEMKQRIIEQLNQPLAVTDLAINGHSLMTELQLKPGPILGKILDELLEKVLENPELNTKKKLLSAAKKIIAVKT